MLHTVTFVVFAGLRGTFGSASYSRARGPGSIFGLATFVSPTTVLEGSCQFLNVHLVLVKHLRDLSLPRNSVVRLTDLPGMTIAVYHGCKTTKPQP